MFLLRRADSGGRTGCIGFEGVFASSDNESLDSDAQKWEAASSGKHLLQEGSVEKKDRRMQFICGDNLWRSQFYFPSDIPGCNDFGRSNETGRISCSMLRQVLVS